MLRRFAALLGVLGLLAAACAPAAPPSAASPVATPVPAPTAAPARPGSGTFVWVSLFEPSRLNPIAAPDVVTKRLMDLIFDGLVTVNEKMELVPELAEKIDVSPDGLTYTFTLKPNARWHDGQPVTSADAKFTFDTIRDPNTKGTISKQDYAAVASIDTPDPRTVVFTLKSVDASFLSKLAIGIAPKHLLEGQDLATTPFNRQPVGSGPFTVREWASGQQLVLEANPDYVGTKPAIQRFVYKLVKDSSSVTLALINGEADAGGPVPPADLPQVRNRRELQLVETVDANTYIGFQVERKPFDDRRVRQALTYALDKDAIVARILEGQAIRATSDILPNSWAYNPDVNRFPRDVAKAKSLLDAAGWTPGPDGIRVKDGQPLRFQVLTNAGDKTREEVLLFARQQWREVGVEMEPQFLELNTFINDRVLKANFDAIFLAASVSVDPDMSRRLHSRSITQGNNFLRYVNPQVDSLLEQGLATTDQSRRRAIYAQIQQIVADDVPMIPIYYPRPQYAFRATVKGVSVTPASPFWAAEKWQP